MKIETERLLLRPYAPEDADEQFRITSDPEFRRHMGPQFRPTRDKVLVGIGRFTEHWYQFGYGAWALELKGEGRLVGYCGMRHLLPSDEVELFYGCDRDYWGRGLVTEAARASLRYGFGRMGFARVMAVTDKANLGSRRVMEKCGLRYERDTVYFDLPVVYYAVNRGDYRPDGSPYTERE
ncbi:MAG: GNAT family N-acetyltransferase [Acidobacteria bacterium]|nr:GNAT family N-acetyltransferase [Acidobacteriota bacterium]